MKYFYQYEDNKDLNLQELLIESFDNILITDSKARIVLFSKNMVKALRLDGVDISGKTIYDLIDRGYYTKSTALECMKLRKQCSGIVHVAGSENEKETAVFSTSTPIFDDKGELRYVITNSRNEAALEFYARELETEKLNASKYQDISKYLSKLAGSSGEVVTNSASMQKVMKLCSLIAKADSVVLITGESGVGKEVVSRYIHDHSPRKDEVFVPVNCGAIPGDLVEAELFGYTKGAFTGANPNGSAGLFELAHKGTIFLDEIGELPLSMQSKLLRVIETGEIRRLGDTKYRKVDARIVAATNRNLEEMVTRGEFREDLFYRLNVIPLLIAPLRDRKEDIIPLAYMFLNRFNRKFGLDKRMSKNTLDNLLDYSWPGNIREMRNVIERYVIITPGNEIDISFDENKKASENRICLEGSQSGLPVTVPLKSAMDDFERKYVEAALRDCNGSITKAAEVLGIHRTHLYKKLKKQG
ncbi:sigma-54 interaction domain-containing protein [Youngiibacter multivorans]|uniref:Transcriptional regulator with PAS, ATPase and Fis domain n=1 Tax=Youngiibacter multivorans TaxID=937251 RepID=A0ABS4FZW0_9CLOT|nr:sigma 54-interacting transcriptional regulator [Youngiibacter multivorans]MBP1917838.1 transcriptional regulator with PAS, ATPase and Fis domain [Youngiibacter multivorans]